MGPTYEVVIETPRFGVIKRRADGAIDFVSPIPCPFNYGRIEGTVSGDGDPLDAIVLGPRLALGARVSAEHRATVRFVDDGRDDPKLVLSDRPISGFEAAQLQAFFHLYAQLKRGLNLARGKTGTTRLAGYEPNPG